MVKASDGSIFKMKEFATPFQASSTLFTKILVDSEGYLSILGMIVN
jgi:hypothetical protein